MTELHDAISMVGDCWRLLFADMGPELRLRSDVRRLDDAVRELQAALRPPPLDDQVRRDRRAVVAERLAELGPPPPWQMRRPTLSGEAE